MFDFDLDLLISEREDEVERFYERELDCYLTGSPLYFDDDLDFDSAEALAVELGYLD